MMVKVLTTALLIVAGSLMTVEAGRVLILRMELAAQSWSHAITVAGGLVN
jgi:hypothetical protein